MPTHTWNQLPPDKRQRFITAAVRTFATHPYAQASLSTLVRELGIAKGSVYQYFADKEDCYLTMVTIAHERILVALRERIPASMVRDADVFVVLRRFCAESVSVALDYPDESALLRRAEHEGGTLAEQVRVLSAHILRSFVIELTTSSAAQQQLRADIDSEAVVFVLQSVLSQVTNHIAVHMAVRDDADAATVRAAAQRIVVFFDAILSVLEYGLRAPRVAGAAHAES